MTELVRSPIILYKMNTVTVIYVYSVLAKSVLIIDQTLLIIASKCSVLEVKFGHSAIKY
jgi:hypothetical protein